MLLNHTADFADFAVAEPAAALMAPTTPMAQADLQPTQPEDHNTCGAAFVFGTLLETPQGWTAVQDLRPGDRVHTLDGGCRPLVSTTPAPALAGLASAAWHVPAQAINNCSDILIDADQRVALRGRYCERYFGLPIVLAPIAAFDGYNGIRRDSQTRNAPRVQLHFEEDEIVWAQTGALLHVSGTRGESPYRSLSLGEARALLALQHSSRRDAGQRLAA